MVWFQCKSKIENRKKVISRLFGLILYTLKNTKINKTIKQEGSSPVCKDAMDRFHTISDIGHFICLRRKKWVKDPPNFQWYNKPC